MDEQTKQEVQAMIDASLANYYNKTQTTTQINTAVSNRVTETEFETTLQDYYTKSEVDPKFDDVMKYSQVHAWSDYNEPKGSLETPSED